MNKDRLLVVSCDSIFFNFLKDHELWVDQVGMYLPNLDAARAEAIHAWQELVDIGATTQEVPDCYEMLIRDSDSDTGPQSA
jgi:hypothetical protein